MMYTYFIYPWYHKYIQFLSAENVCLVFLDFANTSLNIEVLVKTCACSHIQVALASINTWKTDKQGAVGEWQSCCDFTWLWMCTHSLKPEKLFSLKVCQGIFLPYFPIIRISEHFHYTDRHFLNIYCDHLMVYQQCENPKGCLFCFLKEWEIFSP